MNLHWLDHAMLLLYLAGMAGKAIYMQGNAGGDVFRGREGPIRTKLIQEYTEAFRGRKFQALGLDTSSGLLTWSAFWPLFGREIAATYERGDSLFESIEVFGNV